MPINPQHSGSFTFLDYSEEKSTMSFFFGPITALTIADFLTEFGDLRTATDAITIGTLIQDSWTGDTTKYNNIAPSDVDAQRERKFLVTYEDSTTFALYRVEIPTADFTGRLVAGTDDVNLANTQVAAWITAYEQLCRSPEGNAVNVIGIRAVGRST